MRLVKGVLNRCLEVLERLSVDSQWRRLSDIAAALDLPKGAVHRLLAELQSLGWIEQDLDTERYRLTLKLALLGQQYLRATGLPGIAQPILDEVAKRCRELVRLTVLQDNALHWLAASQGAPTGLMYQPTLNGRLIPHTTANGKIWLSTLDEVTAVRLATQGGLGQPGRPGLLVGPRALRDADSLLRDLAACRTRGFGVAIEEAEPGVKALAVIVLAHDDQRVLGTMSIAGPLVRMGPERDAEFHALLEQAAGTLALVWPHDNLPLTGSG
ncbi:MAG: IclR family transcriptional regulator [Rhodoferax sp.]|nr:IclR family transcriptional regulator [Rhodoferax sp.]